MECQFCEYYEATYSVGHISKGIAFVCSACLNMLGESWVVISESDAVCI